MGGTEAGMSFSNAARFFASGCLGVWLIQLAGCGGGAAPPPAQAPAAGVAPAPAAPGVAPGAAPATPPVAGATAPAAAGTDGGPVQSPPQAVDPQRKETRWLGKIPYDVFYDRPLVVASDQTPLAGGTAVAAAPGTAAPMPTGAAPMPSPMPSTGAPASSGKFDLAKLVAIDALIEESKQGRTRLTTGLQKLGDFNKNFKDVSSEAAILASVTAAVGQYPAADKPNWKDKAKFVRDLSKEISSKATDKGSERYNSCKNAFEKICEMMDGGKAPAGESKDQIPFSEVTTLSDIMWRFQKTFDYLKLNINDEKRFKDEKSAVERETMIFNLLTAIMATEGYEYLDDDEYMQYQKKLAEGTAGTVQAVEGGDFAKFRTSLNMIQQAMDECHPKYRTGG